MTVHAEIKQIRELADLLQLEPDCVLYASELKQHADSLLCMVRGPGAFTPAHAERLRAEGRFG